MPLNLSIFFFLLVGSLAALVHLGAECAIVQSGLAAPLTGNIFAFMTASVVGYIGHRFLTFRGRSQRPHFIVLMRHFLIASLGFLLNQSIFFLLLVYAKLPYLWALLLAILTVPALTYVLSRWWTFA